MGINKATADELVKIARVKKGKVLTYGVQNQIKTGFDHQTEFFKSLGYTTVESLDYYNKQHPTYVGDLNGPLDKKLMNQYDCVFDGGTMEHIFDTVSVLTNSVNLLKVGGRIIHTSPLTGWINHGFYHFNPTLFVEFYEANNFKDFDMRVRIDDKYHQCKGIKVPPEVNGKKVLLLFTAIKTENKKVVLPIQEKYRRKYGKKYRP